MPRGGAESLEPERFATRCWPRRAGADARAGRTVEERDLDRVHSPLMSPLVWDLGHIAAFEDLWLGQRAGGLDPLRPDCATSTTRPRPRARAAASMPYLRRDDALEYMEAVRERALAVLDRADLSPTATG